MTETKHEQGFLANIFKSEAFFNYGRSVRNGKLLSVILLFLICNTYLGMLELSKLGLVISDIVRSNVESMATLQL